MSGPKTQRHRRSNAPASGRTIKPDASSPAAVGNVGVSVRDWLSRIDPTLVVVPLLGTAVGVFAYFTSALLLYDPPVWPDEALFANPAINLIRHGHLGTDLMTGYLPGIETHTYWMPPFYFVVMAAVFALFDVSAVVMRSVSVFAGAMVLALTYLIGRRVGLGRGAASIAVAVLAVDAVFLRAARLGRMDMLTVALILAALYATLLPSPRAAIVAGVLAGLAILTHPLGVIAPVAITVHHLFSGDAQRWRRVLLFACGAVGAPLLWGLYILGDMPAFLAQFGSQIGRKAVREPFGLAFVWRAFQHALEQYNDSGDLTLGDPRDAAALVWLIGTVGVIVYAIRQPSARVVAIAHCLALTVALLSYEMWYPVYCLPTLALGVGGLIGPALDRVPGRPIAALAIVVSLVWFAARTLAYEEALLTHWTRSGESADYGTFCRAVDARIPSGSRVFVSLFPDLYLCLSHRADLSFRSFVPEQFPVDQQTQRRVIDESDIIITSRWSPGSMADAIARRDGQLIGEVGPRRSYAYHALVYRMSKTAAP